MVNNTEVLKQLEKFGVSEKEGETYLTLLQNGVLSPLEISRMTEINRTTIYRILEKLKKIGLIEEILNQNTTKAKAVKPDQFQRIIAKKEAEIEDLKNTIPVLTSQLNNIKQTSSPSTTSVKYYRGKEGLRQILWNVLKAESELVGYGYIDWNAAVGKSFAEKIRQEIVSRNIISKEISNRKIEKNLTSINNYFDHYSLRIVPESKITINHDTYIYNDVFSFSHFFKDELFGVEIKNKEIAKTQKQIFYILWGIAK